MTFFQSSEGLRYIWSSLGEVIRRQMRYESRIIPKMDLRVLENTIVANCAIRTSESLSETQNMDLHKWTYNQEEETFSSSNQLGFYAFYIHFCFEGAVK